MTDQTQMLPDGSNPEGVDPYPPLNWTSKSDLTDVVVHGPVISPPTTKLRCYLTFAGIPHEHKQHMLSWPMGFKPGTDYKKVPIIDVAGRQVNDSAIILKYLLPVLGIAFDQAWEDRFVLELDTSFKLHCTPEDWGRLATVTMGIPGFVRHVVGPLFQGMERKQALRNIATSGLGHVEVDEAEIARDFKSSMKGRFHNGDTAGHVDLSLYGFLAGYILARSPIALKLIADAGLQDWVDSMDQIVPMHSLFPAAQ